MNRHRLAVAVAAASLLLVGAGCGKAPQRTSGTGAPVPPPQAAVPPAAVVAVNAGAPEVPQFTQCMLAASGAITLYMRADAKADVFGKLADGDAVVVGGKTADGWYGFDPAAAQAPNVGPFRLRWIKPGEPYVLTGGCDKLTVFPHVPPGVCYVMAETDAPVRDSLASDAKVVVTMHYGDYAEAVGRKGPSSAVWIKIDPGSGTLHHAGTGWVSMENVNFNGPCEKLPVEK